MNAHQRRKYRRSLPAYSSCNRLGYSGTTSYPDLMCADGYMTDQDADGYDPTTSRLPCRDCNPVEYAEWMLELEEESEPDGDEAIFAEHGL
jgi:hypothetical protein